MERRGLARLTLQRVGRQRCLFFDALVWLSYNSGPRLSAREFPMPDTHSGDRAGAPKPMDERLRLIIDRSPSDWSHLITSGKEAD